MMIEPFVLDLRLFDGDGTGGDGGGGAGAAEGTPGDAGVAEAVQTTGHESAAMRKAITRPGTGEPRAVVPKQAAPALARQEQETPEQPPDRAAEYDRLIDQYKDIHTERVKEIISKRFPKAKAAEEQLGKMTPLLDLVAQKYNVDPGNLEALQQAIQSDDALYEDEAIKRGLTLDQAKEAVLTEKRLAAYEAQEAERQKQAEINRITTGWLQEGEKLKEIYPGFDIYGELRDPRFIEKLQIGYAVRDAYESLHRDEIFGSVMTSTARKVQEKTVNDIRARGNRPLENGAAAPSPQATYSKLPKTKAERDEIVKRALAGEKITF